MNFKAAELGIKNTLFKNTTFTVSIGAVSIWGNNDDINDIEDAIKVANKALYMAKSMGRNCVVTLESGLEDSHHLKGKIANLEH